MKEDLRIQLQGISGPVEGRNRLREYLQARMLVSLQRSGAMIPLAFQGGTALRFLYSIRRYSEDLDFALERPDRGYDFRSYLRAIQADLKREGYEVEVKINDKRTVHSASIRFPGLLFELGLSRHPNEVFSIKIEVDTNLRLEQPWRRPSSAVPSPSTSSTTIRPTSSPESSTPSSIAPTPRAEISTISSGTRATQCGPCRT